MVTFLSLKQKSPGSSPGPRAWGNPQTSPFSPIGRGTWLRTMSVWVRIPWGACAPNEIRRLQWRSAAKPVPGWGTSRVARNGLCGTQCHCRRRFQPAVGGMIAGGVMGNMPAFEAGDFPVRGRACKWEKEEEISAGVVEWFKTAACKAAAPCAHRGFESRLRL